MKKKVKGFTLIECLVALAILGISSLLMVQAYTQLMRMTNMNNAIQVSISRQMADAERGAAADANVKKFRTDSDFEMKAEYPFSSNVYSDYNGNTDNYKCKVDVYAVYGFTYKNNTEMRDTTGSDEDANSVRYIYFHG